jgi:hypothetical protein
MYHINIKEAIVSGSLPRGITYDGGNLAETSLYRDFLAAEVNGASVQGMGEIDYSFQMNDLGGISGRNECVVRLLNQEFLSDTFLLYDIDNTNIEIWQGYLKPSGTIAIDTDCLLLFKGVIYEWNTWDHNLITLKCLDNLHLVDVKMPLKIINTTTFPHAPDGLVNKPIPILIGDFKTENTAAHGNRVAYEVGLYNLAPTVMTNEKTQQFYVSAEPWDNPADAVYWQESDSPWVAILNNSAITHTDDGSTFYFTIGPDGYASVYIKPIIITPRNTADNWENCLDADQSNYTQVGYVSIGSPNEKLALKFNDFTAPGQFIPDNASGAEHGFTGATDYKLHIECSNTSGDVQLVVRRLATGVEDIHPTLIVNGTQTYNLQTTGTPANNWDAMKDYEWRLERLSATGYTRVVNVWVECRSYVDLARTVTVAEPSTILSSNWNQTALARTLVLRKDIVPARGRTSIYVSTKGIKYGAWISAGGRSVGYATGEVIQNPAYTVEYILRDILGVATADIDTAAFDLVGNTTTGLRKDWKIAASIGATQKAMEHIRQICREFCLILYQDPNDSSGNLRFRLVAMPSYSTTVNLIVTEAMIHIDEVSGFPSLFFVEMTPQASIQNDIYINYKRNYVTDKHDLGVFVSDIDDDNVLETNLTSDTGAIRETTYSLWLAASQSKYLITGAVTYDLDYIRDTPTANLFLKLVADYRAFRRVKVAMNLLRTLDTLSLRIGDVITVASGLLGANHTGYTHFMVTRTNYPGVDFKCPPYITVEAEEIPSTITGARVASAMMDRHMLISSVTP